MSEAASSADRSLEGKLRRRLVRLEESRPMVSFAFDDAPVSTVHGAALLARPGWRATFYISAGLAGTDGSIGAYAAPAHWRALERPMEPAERDGFDVVTVAEGARRIGAGR